MAKITTQDNMPVIYFILYTIITNILERIKEEFTKITAELSTIVRHIEKDFQNVGTNDLILEFYDFMKIMIDRKYILKQ